MFNFTSLKPLILQTIKSARDEIVENVNIKSLHNKVAKIFR